MPQGILMYSIKALQTGLESLPQKYEDGIPGYVYTNANGPSQYQKCETECFKDRDENNKTLREYLIEHESQENYEV